MQSIRQKRNVMERLMFNILPETDKEQLMNRRSVTAVDVQVQFIFSSPVQCKVPGTRYKVSL